MNPFTRASLATNPRLGSWIRFEDDRTVTIFTGKVDIGQGISTALAQIAADELDVAPERIRLVRPSTATSPDEGVTSGSLSIQDSGSAIRIACADARASVLARAARRLEASVDDLVVRDGVIGVAGTDLATSYWDCVDPAMYERDVAADTATKPPAAYTIVGRPIARRDLPAKFSGAPTYLQDLELPEMLYGRVVRPPRQGARLAVCDESAVAHLPGVRVVRDGTFLGVMAEREEIAVKARAALAAACAWTGGEMHVSPENLFAHLQARARPGTVVAERGSAAPESDRRLTATYTRPYIAHASIGPSAAAAQWQGDRLTIWSHSQGIFNLRRDIARTLRTPEDSVVIHHMEGAGCYGHNGADDVALDAALLARAAHGRPVLLQWMRDDEFAWEPFGPAMVVRLEARLDARGNILGWQHDLWSNGHTGRPGRTEHPNLLAAWHLAEPFPQPPAINPPLASGGGADRNAVPGYDFAWQRIVNHYVEDQPLRVSSLRGLGAHANVFAIESFIDELAHAASCDPVEYRLRHITDPRARAVVEAAAERAGWARWQRAEGRGHGIAWARYKNLASWCAAVVELSAHESIRIERIVLAVDAGLVINPDGLINQIEGGAIQAASWTLLESVRFDRTGVTSRAWEHYPILKFSDVPPVEVVLVNRPHERALGAGEPAQGPVAAAIGNALFDALGVRVRDMPITFDRVAAAIG